MACHRGRGSGCSRPGCGVSPLAGGHHLPHHRASRTYRGLGKQTLGGYKQNLVHSRTQEKGTVTPQETDPDLPMSVQEWRWRLRSAVACCRVGGTECGSACMGPFEGGRHLLHYHHHSLVSGQTTGREHRSTHQQKIGLKIYWAWPCPSEQGPVSPTVCLSHQEASIISLLVISGQTEWKPQSQKINQIGHMDHSLV